MELILGLIYLFLMASVMMAVGTLVGDIIMMRVKTKISWRDSIKCGWLYFIDRFKK